MASQRNDPMSDHSANADPKGFNALRSPSQDPDDDGPKSSGFLNEGDGVPPKDEPRAPRRK